MAGETSEDEDVSMASLSTSTMGNSSNVQRKKKATDAGDAKTVAAPATKKTKNVLPTVITTPLCFTPRLGHGSSTTAGMKTSMFQEKKRALVVRIIHVAT